MSTLARFPIGLVAGVLIGVVPADANCYGPSPSDIGTTAAAIQAVVSELEQHRSEPRGAFPNVLLRVSATQLNAIGGVPDDMLEKTSDWLQEASCPNLTRLERAIREATASGVNYVRGDLADIQRVLKRVTEIGAWNMDADSANVLKLHDINYLADLSIDLSIEEDACKYPVFATVGLDVISVESGVVRSRQLPRFPSALNRHGLRDGLIFKLEADEYSRDVVIEATTLGVCFGNTSVRVNYPDSALTARHRWEEDLDCLAPGESTFVEIPDEVTMRIVEICVGSRPCNAACSDPLRLPSP